MRKLHKRNTILVSVIMAAMLTFSACSTNTSVTSQANKVASTSEFVKEASESKEVEADYHIGLSDTSVIIKDSDNKEVNVEGINVSDGVVTISIPGSFDLSGTISEGQVVVDVDKTTYPDAKVELILNGVSISNSNDSAIFIKSVGDKTVLTVKEGTENVISDGSDYTNSDEGCAAIYSKDDLKIKGKGTLCVYGNCKDGIVCKDDLKIYNGNILSQAVVEGIIGKDSVVIGEEGKEDYSDLNITILSGEDFDLSSADSGFGGFGGGSKGNPWNNKNDSNSDNSNSGNSDGKNSQGFNGQAPGGMNPPSGFDGQMPDGQTPPSGFDGQKPDGFTPPDGMTPPEGFNGQAPDGMPSPDNNSSDQSNVIDTSSNSESNSNSSSTSDRKSKDRDGFGGGKGGFGGGRGGFDFDDGKEHSKGIKSDESITINGGTLTITKCYEGLEANLVTIAGGDVSIYASDDVINSCVETGTGIRFTGGNFYGYALGDGFDCNSTSQYEGISFEGGNIVIISNSGMNSSIDTERGYSYSGGKIVAITSGSSMFNEQTNCKNFSDIGLTKSMSATTSDYIVVNDGDTTVTLVLPVDMSMKFNYLGNKDATVSVESSTSATLDSNNVSWN